MFVVFFSDAHDYAALLVLPVHLRKKLAKFLLMDGEQLTSSYPIIVLSDGTFFHEGKFSVVPEAKTLCTTQCLLAAFKCFIAPYYVFNFAFPKSQECALNFLVRISLGHREAGKKDQTGKSLNLLSKLNSMI